MPSRRRFLEQLAAAGIASMSGRLNGADPTRSTERVNPALDQLVGLLRDTPREPLLEELVSRIRAGLRYPQLLGAVAEAAAREVSPYPVVGYQYHAFMVMQSVHLTTIRLPAHDRWLPLLWAADLFKEAQAQDERETAWSMGPTPRAADRSGRRAEPALEQALQHWDAEAADAAVVAMLQSRPWERVLDVLFHYAARDFRHIGHKPITAANCHRLIQTLGPGQAVPLLRSLTYAIQNHGDGPNPASADLAPDRPWRRNLELIDNLPENWLQPVAGSDPAGELLPVLREGSSADAVEAVIEASRRGAGAHTLWQTLFAAAAELLMRQSGIIAVHVNTSTNALHYAFRHHPAERTRRLLLLQAAAFLPLFRDLMRSGEQRELRIDTLQPLAPEARGDEQVAAIFAEIDSDRLRAARRTLGYLQAGGAAEAFMQEGRGYTVTRNLGYHDYKFTEAVFENAAYMGSPWRERCLAASVFYLNAPGDRRHPVAARARELLATG